VKKCELIHFDGIDNTCHFIIYTRRTFDYATSNVNFGFECQCGSNTCRHVVSGADWQNEELVARLGKEAFWPFLKAKILKREREGGRKH